jgi:hypothetical protein
MEDVTLQKLVRTIAVRDANGDEMTLFEYRELRSVFSYARKSGHLRLCTGEEVRPSRGNSFMIAETGERLTRRGTAIA